MSRMLNTYSNLKLQNSDMVYLFKNGAFFVAIKEDAKLLSEALGLKITNLNADTIKCGFPCSSYDKYSSKLNELNISFKIIAKDTVSDSFVYSENETIKNLLKLIKELDINSLSVSEAFSFIEKIQNIVNKLGENKLWVKKVIQIY